MADSKFGIPSLIPSLPSGNKENERHNLKGDTSWQEPAKQRPALGMLTPQQPSSSRRPLSAAQDRPKMAASPSPGPLTTIKNGQPRRVLRYGETMESLFCLSENSSPEMQQLCLEICDGTLADDTSAWRCVLELAEKERSTSDGGDLIRMHRRATVRFSLDSTESTIDQVDILAMWMMYARVQAKFGSADEARMTYRHIQNQRVSLNATFYLTLADFEKEQKDLKRAEDALLLGIKENAEPIQELQEALDEMRRTQTFSSMIPPLPPKGMRSPKGARSPKRKSMDSPAPRSPKRIRTEDGAVRIPEKKSEPNDTENKPTTFFGGKEGESDGSRSLLGSRLLQTTKREPLKPRLVGSSLLKSKPAQVTLASASKTPSTRERKSRILSTRLGRTGLGRAARVDPETSMINESESEQESDYNSDTTELTGRAANLMTEQKPAATIKKLDLNYMWNWDPTARETTQDTAQLRKKPTMEKIDEGSTRGPTTDATQGTTPTDTGSIACSINSTEQKSIHSHKSEHLSSAIKTTNSHNSRQSLEAEQPQRHERSEKEVMVEKANLDFLPLVMDQNILTVNNIPYVKLGVIGKGGSCKVYRALSKKCAVVAIKKVKLAGMDRKAIEGYANEISLLKRLRGNPAIIQMYDSEVDLERKSIFVVMEVGEVDLNHVLQQRAVSSGDAPSKQSRSLNLNFIRLTWQQMLSAVHCIHEERIIHSDLKPANFLFVRGALKLIDFGIAKAIQSDDTNNIYRESHIGTLNYMSPEAILDTGSGNNGPRMKIGRASDVWSLGCILFEMVYGKTPFAALHFIQKLQAIVNPNHEIEFPDHGDEDAIDAIKQCFLRNPEERPPIVGKNGLLNEHRFLHSGKQQSRRHLSKFAVSDS
jgi:serine/threonine-protein kinase TTK/MPS1